MRCNLACGRAAELVTDEYFGRTLRVCRTCLARVECQRCRKPPGIHGTCGCGPEGRPTLPKFVPLRGDDDADA
jgi:hypothetical protein